WGSHPGTDPLHSTSRLRVIHDGPNVDRWDRTEFISRFEVAMRHLHVCPRKMDSRNCGECRKCYLVKLTLEVLGSRDSPVFDKPEIDLEVVKRLYARPPGYATMFAVVAARARAAARPEIADAIARSIERSARRAWWIRMGERLRTTRGLWRL